jgi:hypothetical protein
MLVSSYLLIHIWSGAWPHQNTPTAQLPYLDRLIVQPPQPIPGVNEAHAAGNEAAAISTFSFHGSASIRLSVPLRILAGLIYIEYISNTHIRNQLTAYITWI